MILLKDNPNLLSDRLSNGLMALPFYRTAILDKENYIDKPLGIHIKKRILSSFSFLKYPKRLCFPQTKIVVFSSTLFDIKDGDHFFNQLHGFYKKAFPNDTTVIEDCDIYGNWRRPNQDGDISYCHTMIMCICRIFAIFMSRIKGINNASLDNIISTYPLLSTRQLAYDNYLGTSSYWIYKRIFRRRKTKLIVLNCASYGGTFAAITRAAHECGITVVETQHGMINDIHYVYNVESFVYNSEEYKKYLPDYLLTFGQFWNEHSYIPVNKYIIGNPYLDFYKRFNSFNKENNTTNKTIVLFISQPDVIVQFLPIALQLSSYSQYEIVFRLHPFDNLTKEMEEQLSSKGVKISYSSISLYDDILHSSVVIGGNSTCLYEAMGLGRPVLVFSNVDTIEMYKDKKYLLFNNFEELLMKLESGVTIENVEAEYYYAGNFNEKYNNFINSIWK